MMTSLSVGGGGGSIGAEVGDIEERGRGKVSCRRGEEERGKKRPGWTEPYGTVFGKRLCHDRTVSSGPLFPWRWPRD
jgi:hypothetical protein